MFQPIYHVSVSPTDGDGPTQGQRKTLTRVGFVYIITQVNSAFGAHEGSGPTRGKRKTLTRA